MMIYFARVPFILPLLLYGVLGLLIPDFVRPHHALWMAFGMGFLLLLDTALDARRHVAARQAAAARQQAASRRAAAARRQTIPSWAGGAHPAAFLGDAGHPPADPRLN